MTARFQGQIDTPLTPLGLRQAGALGKRLSGIELHGVYASPLERARQTAGAIAELHGLPVQILPELTEMYGGAMEGMSFTELQERDPEQFRMFDELPHKFVGPEDSESMALLYARAVSAIEGIAAAHPGQNVAVVSHGCLIRCLVCHAQGGTLQTLGKTKWSANTGLFHITYDASGQVALHSENDLTHLEGLLPEEIFTGV